MNNSSSKILFLIICSNKKNSAFGKPYSSQGAFSNLIDHDTQNELFTCRRRIFELILNSKIQRDNKRIIDLPYNLNLKLGPDIEPHSKNDFDDYLEAIERYEGRFYARFDSNDKEYIRHSKHHILIVSGLYGLLTPEEMVQLYSINVRDSEEVKNVWIENDRLTEILSSYIKKNAISCIFELMGHEEYIRLISWEKLRHEKIRVLHTFSEEFAGPEKLSDLGILFKHMIYQDSDELIGIKTGEVLQIQYRITQNPEPATLNESRPGFQSENIYFEDFHIPPSNKLAYREKPNDAITKVDLIGRMRRNIIQIHHKNLPESWFSSYEKKHDDTPNKYYIPCCKELILRGGFWKDLGAKMIEFEKLRNIVEYRWDIHNPISKWDEIKNTYESIIERAFFHDVIASDEIEEVLLI